MHLSFASPAPGYPGTSGDSGQTCSLEADKSPANIRQLPRRAGHLRYRVTYKGPALIPWENPDKVLAQILAQMITIKPPPQPCTCFPPARCQRAQIPTLSQQVPRYCPVPRGPGYKWKVHYEKEWCVTMIKCHVQFLRSIGIHQNLKFLNHYKRKCLPTDSFFFFVIYYLFIFLFFVLFLYLFSFSQKSLDIFLLDSYTTVTVQWVRFPRLKLSKVKYLNSSGTCMLLETF